MSPKDWMAALRVAGRELRAGIRGFGVFLGCLFLGVLAISAVGSVGRALEEGLSRDARAIGENFALMRQRAAVVEIKVKPGHKKARPF